MTSRGCGGPDIRRLLTSDKVYGVGLSEKRGNLGVLSAMNPFSKFKFFEDGLCTLAPCINASRPSGPVSGQNKLSTTAE